MASHSYFSNYLQTLKLGGLYPKIHTVTGPSSSPEITINGKKFLTFSSNNYLGIASNEKIEEEVISAIKKYGIGSGSTRLLSGTLDVQVDFEKYFAEFLGYDQSITFSSGYLANASVIRMLVDPFPYFQILNEGPGIILSEELNHASIIDGVKLAKAEHEVFKHNDMQDLEEKLLKHKGKHVLVITDGVFSMDGELANLKEITRLTKKYRALLMVDDSHAVGVLGPNGEGTAHHLGVEKDVDVLMGSYTKAFGSIGGFISADNALSDYLRITARGYIFSDPILPAIVKGLHFATRIIKEEGSELRKKVLENSEYLRSSLRKRGFTMLGEGTPIVPLFIGDEKKAIKFYDKLTENGILAPCIRRPAVLLGKERIRFSVMASHEKAHIDQLLSICEEIGKNQGLI